MPTDDRDQQSPEAANIDREPGAPQQPETVDTERAEQQAEQAVPELKDALRQFGEAKPILDQLNKSLDSSNGESTKKLLWQLDQFAGMRAIRSAWNRLPTFAKRALYHMPPSPMTAPLIFLQPLVEFGFLDLDDKDLGTTTEKSIGINSGIQKIALKVVMLLEPEFKVLAPLIPILDKMKGKQGEYRNWLRQRRAQEKALNEKKDGHGHNKEAAAAA